MFNPKYKVTNKILKMLTEITEAKVVIERARLLPKQEINLRRQALIRMTHSSTAIEGNMLNIKEVEALYNHQKIDAPSRDIYEVENYLKAMKYIESIIKKKGKINEKTMLRIHGLVTNKTLPKEQSGVHRKKAVYVVKRKLGKPQEIVYTAPNAKVIPRLCSDLIAWLLASKNKEMNPVITAGIVHQEIAAIHPFSDGNGRTARAMATLLLYSKAYDFRQLFALEDYYNKDRPNYYKAIDIGKNYKDRKTDFTSWLEYFTKGFKEEILRVKIQVLSFSSKKINDEIGSQIYLNKDQVKIIDFMDQMGKITISDIVDILECPKRTAQLNLQKLKKLGLIKQVGKGPASGYILEK